jgi:hypothetical protein
MKLKKGSAEAKAFMAKIRAKKGITKKVGAKPVKIKQVPKDASTSTYKRDRDLYNKLLRDYDKYSGLYMDANNAQRKILQIKLNKIESALSKYERNVNGTSTDKRLIKKSMPKSTKGNWNLADRKQLALELGQDFYSAEDWKKLTGKTKVQKKITGWKKGNTRFLEKGEKPFKTKKFISLENDILPKLIKKKLLLSNLLTLIFAILELQ